MAARDSSGSKIMTALLSAKPGTQDELQQTLRSLVGEIQQQPGCTSCVLAQDVTGGPRFVLYVAWVDGLSMEASLASEPFRVLLGAASTLGDQARFRLSVNEPEPAPARSALPRRSRAL
jgi:quinol monooxygenase YgiN